MREALESKPKGPHDRIILDEFEGRKMQIYLPPSYNTSEKRYPVVYMHDGQNLFDPTTAYIVEWKVDNVLDRLITKKKVEEMLVVGIYNGIVKRVYEYLPYADNVLELKAIKTRYNPGAKEFADFVTQKVIPYIDKKYRTRPNRTDRAIMGSSLGGLSALWTGYTYSDIFSMIGAISPSLWVGNGQVFRDFSYRRKKDVKIWYDIGTLEWSDYTALIDILEKKGFSYGHDLLYYEVKGGHHHETAWSQRIAYPLIMFKGKPPQKIVNLSVDIEVVQTGAYGIATKLNPVVKMDNGIKYSLYKYAQYEMLTKEYGWINDRGYFGFTSNKNLEISVKYEQFEKHVTVNYKRIQREITCVKQVRKRRK